MDLNQVTLVGRLVDAVLYTPGNGTKSSRAVGRLIVNRPPSQDGKRRYDAIQIVGWGPHADNLAKYTDKGKELGVTGELRVNSVPPQKEGEAWKNYTEVTIRGLSFGRDSNQAKLMKALSGGAETVAAGVTGQQQVASNARAIIAANPQIAALLQSIAQGAAPTPASNGESVEPPSATAEVREVGEEPETETADEETEAETPFAD